MSRRRRAVVLLGLALLLGGLAASDVARRESALRAQLGPVVAVVVARGDLDAGRRLRAGDLALRRVPRRYAPVGAAGLPAELVGQRLAAPVPRGGDLGVAQLETDAGVSGPAVREGRAGGGDRRPRRARTSSSRARGSTCSSPATASRAPPPGTQLALEDVEVLAARRAPDAADDGADRVAATLRVSVEQAVYLAAAQSFAREVRLLPRAVGDRGRDGRDRGRAAAALSRQSRWWWTSTASICFWPCEPG